MAPVGLAVTRDRVVSRCNRRFCDIFGYPAADLEGALLAKLYPSNEEFLEVGRMGRAAMLTCGYYQDERIMKRADGELFWCRVRGQAFDLAHPFAQCVWSFADLSDTRPVARLTRRERQVAMLLSQGLSTKDIAQTLRLSPRTIEVYRAKLLEKFDAKNGIELLAKISGMPV